MIALCMGMVACGNGNAKNESAFSAGQIGKVCGRMQAIQRRLNMAVGILFVLIGIYYCITVYL